MVSAFANRGVEARIISTELLNTLKRVTDEVLEDEAAADSDFAEILASQRAFRSEYAEWRRRAYLTSDLTATDRPAPER